MPAQVDLIDELMFRCWARRNYLPPELREAGWHPVILEEMNRRDHELSLQEHEETLLTSRIEDAFVPLVPTVTHYVHPAHSEIREPHFLSIAQAGGNAFSDSIYAGGIYEFGT